MIYQNNIGTHLPSGTYGEVVKQSSSVVMSSITLPTVDADYLSNLLKTYRKLGFIIDAVFIGSSTGKSTVMVWTKR